MMAKRMTTASFKCSCAEQRALRNLFKHAFTCQRPQLSVNQIPHPSMQRRLSYRCDGQETDGQMSFQLYIVKDIYIHTIEDCPPSIAGTYVNFVIVITSSTFCPVGFPIISSSCLRCSLVPSLNFVCLNTYTIHSRAQLRT